ncbi:unnamed protein product [Soboliphyme baturini]|uniref:BRCT domain-containing protein n=1 Tax=Soboliphyme baturini TaxID=241478 RepID=A0A183IJG8_9BILA|nr:unnamed protein product [Soboliphyme baturini]
MAIFRQQILKNGGHIEEKPGASVTHVIIDEAVPIDRVAVSLAGTDSWTKAKLVRSRWLSKCLKEGVVVDLLPFEVCKPPQSPQSMASSRHPDLHDDAIDEPGDHALMATTSDAEVENIAQKGRCSNQEIVERLMSYEVLQVLRDACAGTNDRWRLLSYNRAISLVQKLDRPIQRIEDIQHLRGIGKRLADKIWEIHQFGELRKADDFAARRDVRLLKQFSDIWGVGPVLAEQLVAEGFTSLEDLKHCSKLTRQQKIGLKYYNEILERMDRSEAALIGETVCMRLLLLV